MPAQRGSVHGSALVARRTAEDAALRIVAAHRQPEGERAIGQRDQQGDADQPAIEREADSSTTWVNGFTCATSAIHSAPLSRTRQSG